MKGEKCIVLLSGGMDSTVLVYKMVDTLGSENVVAITFQYGQRHKKEIEFATLTANKLGIEQKHIGISGMEGMAGCSLLDPTIEVPEGHYEDQSMEATVVHNRNAIMLSIAAGIGYSLDCASIYIAAHFGDHAIYQDCRPTFIAAFERMLGTSLPIGMRVESPFILNTKASIVIIGHGLNVPWGDTWSCYKGGALHCGKCGTCVERMEAFEIAKLTDPEVYEK